MSTLPVDNPGIASVPVSSVGDVARLINSGKEQAKYARMIVFLALGGVFLDAYDLTTLSYGIDDVVREFQLSPLLTGLVTSSIMVGTIVGNIIGGWLTDKAYAKNGQIVWNNGMTDEEVSQMNAYARRFQEVNDAILDTDYYADEAE